MTERKKIILECNKNYTTLAFNYILKNTKNIIKALINIRRI